MHGPASRFIAACSNLTSRYLYYAIYSSFVYVRFRGEYSVDGIQLHGQPNTGWADLMEVAGWCLWNYVCIMHIGAATARVARVRTLPTFGILTWDPPKFCSKVLIHYTMDPTIFSTPAAPLIMHDVTSVQSWRVDRLFWVLGWEEPWHSGRADVSETRRARVRFLVSAAAGRRSSALSTLNYCVYSLVGAVLCLASNHGIACALRLGLTQPVTDFWGWQMSSS